MSAAPAPPYGRHSRRNRHIGRAVGWWQRVSEHHPRIAAAVTGATTTVTTTAGASTLAFATAKVSPTVSAWFDWAVSHAGLHDPAAKLALAAFGVGVATAAVTNVAKSAIGAGKRYIQQQGTPNGGENDPEDDPEPPATAATLRQLNDTLQTVVDDNRQLRDRVAQLEGDRDRQAGVLTEHSGRLDRQSTDMGAVYVKAERAEVAAQQAGQQAGQAHTAAGVARDEARIARSDIGDLQRDQVVRDGRLDQHDQRLSEHDGEIQQVKEHIGRHRAEPAADPGSLTLGTELSQRMRNLAANSIRQAEESRRRGTPSGQRPPDLSPPGGQPPRPGNGPGHGPRH